MDERRKEQRFPVNQEAVIWLNGRILKVRLQDVSRSGVRVQMDSAIAPGLDLTVGLKGMMLAGTVQYCNPVGSRFVLGIHVKQPMDRFIKEIAKVDLAFMESLAPK